jgi:hypothetical protein
MIGYVLGGAAALFTALYFWKRSHAENPAAYLFDFSPFTLKTGVDYTLKVLAPTELDAYVQQMFKPDVAQVGQVVRDGGPQAISGPAGQKQFQVYKVRVRWLAPDAVFSQASAIKKMGVNVPAGMQSTRALAATLYVAAASPAGSEQRLRFFPVGNA